MTDGEREPEPESAAWEGDEHYLYAHVGDSETYILVFSENRARWHEQQRDPLARGMLPVLTPDDEVYRGLLEQHRRVADEYRERLKNTDDAISKARSAMQSSNAEAPAERLIALRNKRKGYQDSLAIAGALEIVPPDGAAMLNPQNVVIGVVAHGAAYSDQLRFGGERRLSFRSLARALYERFPRPSITVSLLSCESAGTAERSAYGADPAKHVTSSYDSKVPAQLLVDELADAGFISPRVIGYEGKAVCLPDGPRLQLLARPRILGGDVLVPSPLFARSFMPTSARRAAMQSRKYRHALTYALRGGREILLQAIDDNVTRVRKKQIDPSARGAVVLVAGSQQIFRRLVDEREQLLRTWSGDYESTPAQASQAERRTLRDRLLALHATDVAGPEVLPLLDPEQTKLYVLGFGNAGSARLSTSKGRIERFSLDDVARSLARGGLSREFRSIRLLSDGGADKGGVFRRKSSAQIFADELGRAGFAEPEVTGYRGATAGFSSGLHAQRVLPDGERVRRSTVSKRFAPSRRGVLPCL